ncbi:MAG: DUF2312 domain-containing protein [Methylobacterium sp.]|nr:DUF2312 domain-containing protein [Methylobacterium sp.]
MTNPNHNGGTEALKALFDRYKRLESERITLSADIAELGKEITSAGFSHRVLKRIAKAEIARENGKEKPMQALREESGDLAMYLDTLAPEAGGAE